MYDVLVSTDGRAHTKGAVDRAIDIARKNDSVLHVLYVVNSAEIASDVGFDDLPDIGSDIVSDVANRASEAGVPRVDTAVVHGLRHEAILKYARDYDVDLIVIGRRKPYRRLFRRSVSTKVEAEAPVPVLVVN